MIEKKYCLPIFLTLFLTIGLIYQSNSQPRQGIQQRRGNSQPFNSPSGSGLSQPGYRAPSGFGAPSPVIVQPAPRVIPWSRIVSLQFAINYYRPLSLSFIEFIRRPAYYYGRYVTWKGVVVYDQADRYYVNVPNESAFHFKVVNPNIQTRKWAKNQTVTVVGIVDKTEDSRTQLGIRKHIPDVQAYYVE